MRIFKNSALSATATIAVALLLQGCAATSSSDEMKDTTAKKNRCGSGEMLLCESRSSNGISDGRHGRRSDGRQMKCGCVPESDIEAFESVSLPSDSH